jgi:hypothetical protein
VEGTIDAGNLPTFTDPLDPYTKGQVLVTRNNAGLVQIGGTPGEDQFVVTTDSTPGAFLNILNNGGLTQFDLATPQIQVLGNSGADGLTVSGSVGSTGTFTPDHSVPSAGSFVADGHQIAVDFSSVLASNFDAFTYVTPGGTDAVSVFAGAPEDPVQIVCQSDGLSFPGFVVLNVGTLLLNTGLNDVAGASDDTVNVTAPVGNAIPLRLGFLTGSFGSDTLNASGPVTLVNNPGASLATPTLTVNMTAANLTFEAPVTQIASLNLASGTRASIANGGNRVLVTQLLSLAQNARLDITSNSLIVDHGNSGSAAASVVALIKSAFQPAAPQHWMGPGITSSNAAADPGKAVGYASSQELLGAAGGTFMGVDVDATAMLVTFTIAGDANLDRQVNFGDLVRLAQSYNSATAGWVNGDFTYDDAVNFTDLVVLAQHYNSVLS